MLDKSDFLTFVDSDDCIAENYVEHLLNINENYPNYVPMCGMERFTGSIKGNKRTDNVITYKREKYCCNQYGIHPWACASLFSIDTIQKYNIRFEEKAKFAEDAYFVAKYCSYYDGVAVSQAELYFYYMNPDGGAVNKGPNSFTRQDVLHRFTAYYAYKEAVDIIREHDKTLSEYCKAGFCFLAANILLMIERTGYEDERMIDVLKKELSLRNRIIYTINCNNLKHIFMVNSVAINRRLARVMLDKVIRHV